VTVRSRGAAYAAFSRYEQAPNCEVPGT